jgi:hypothetical protein
MEARGGGDAYDWIFLAMAHWQLGEKDRAREWYDRGLAGIEEHPPEGEELRRFREEAAQLLRVP